VGLSSTTRIILVLQVFTVSDTIVPPKDAAAPKAKPPVWRLAAVIGCAAALLLAVCVAGVVVIGVVINRQGAEQEQAQAHVEQGLAYAELGLYHSPIGRG